MDREMFEYDEREAGAQRAASGESFGPPLPPDYIDCYGPQAGNTPYGARRTEGYEPLDRPRGPARGGRRKNRGYALPAAFMAACLAVSGLFGLAGGYAYHYFKADEAQSAAGEVLYQSVIRTVALGEQPAAQAMTVSEVAATVKPSVVEITTEVVSRSGRMGQFVSEGAGSGVIITSDGTIVTNNHVIDGARSITVRLANGQSYPARLVGADALSDLAVIKIEASDLTPALLGNSSGLMVGETAVAIGNPLGELGGSVTEGIISALDREITIDGETMRLMQTDAAINPGNSGGGLFNLYGELIGIVNAKSSGTGIEGLGFAIPIDTAKSAITDIMEYGYVRGRVDTGLSLVDVQDARTAMMYRVSETGLYIADSANESFQPGDIITAVNGQNVASLADYRGILSGLKVGDAVQITVLRRGQSVTAEIKLFELKP